MAGEYYPDNIFPCLRCGTPQAWIPCQVAMVGLHHEWCKVGFVCGHHSTLEILIVEDSQKDKDIR